MPLQIGHLMGSGLPLSLTGQKRAKRRIISGAWMWKAASYNSLPTLRATLQEDIEPAWSPDSSQIAFIRYSILGDAGDPSSPSGLWLLDVATGEEKLLVEITGLSGRGAGFGLVARRPLASL